MLRRLNEGRSPSFPPSARDAIILGGSIFDLLDREVGRHACDLLVNRLPKSGPVTALETAFGARMREIEPIWMDHVHELATGGPSGPQDGLEAIAEVARAQEISAQIKVVSAPKTSRQTSSAAASRNANRRKSSGSRSISG